MAGDGAWNPAGLRTLATVLPLFALALAVYILRIWTRMRPKCRLDVADHLITVAMLAETISIVLTIVAVSHGFGRNPTTLAAADLDVVGYCTFVVFVVAFWASCLGRISVACLLLQFTQSRAWRAVLWSAIIFQLLLLLGCDLFTILQCQPIQALWKPMPGHKCISFQQNWKLGYVFTAFGMFSDFTFAVLPIALVWKLSRSAVERLLLSVLLGLGLVAFGTGIIKLLTQNSFRIDSPDIMETMMPMYTWSRIEEIVIIIAACAPLLKAPIEGMLHSRLGLPRFYPSARGINTVHSLPSSIGKGKSLWLHGGSNGTSSTGPGSVSV